MKLFGSYTSPYVRHVRIVLQQTQLECEFVEADAKSSALLSPTKKVPFLEDGDITLSDSTSILRYLREKAGQTFLPSVQDLDLYCLATTLLDSAINVFLVELFSKEPLSSPYFDRQQARVQEGVEHLNSLNLHQAPLDQDVLLRLQCFLYWGNFRNRFTLEGLTSLNQILAEANQDAVFLSTAPSEAPPKR